jgi:hypothetical protein
MSAWSRLSRGQQRTWGAVAGALVAGTVVKVGSDWNWCACEIGQLLDLIDLTILRSYQIYFYLSGLLL